MMVDLESVMDEMCVFLDHPITPELRAAVKLQADKQRSYKSEHRYDLQKFGLSEEQIRRDCAFFYEMFLPPLQPTATEAEPPPPA